MAVEGRSLEELFNLAKQSLSDFKAQEVALLTMNLSRPAEGEMVLPMVACDFLQVIETLCDRIKELSENTSSSAPNNLCSLKEMGAGVEALVRDFDGFMEQVSERLRELSTPAPM